MYENKPYLRGVWNWLRSSLAAIENGQELATCQQLLENTRLVCQDLTTSEAKEMKIVLDIDTRIRHIAKVYGGITKIVSNALTRRHPTDQITIISIVLTEKQYAKDSTMLELIKLVTTNIEDSEYEPMTDTFPDRYGLLEIIQPRDPYCNN